MNEELIYSISEEENALAEEALKKDREHREELWARLEGADKAEEEAIYRELTGLSLLHFWQNRAGYEYITNLASEHRVEEAEELARRLLPAYYLWAHCPEENRFDRNKLYWMLMMLGWAMDNAGRKEEAVRYLQLSLKELKLVTEEAGKTEITSGAVVYEELSLLLIRTGQLEASEPVTEEGIRYMDDLRSTLSKENYAKWANHGTRTSLCQMRAATLMEGGSTEECVKIFRENVRVQKEVHDGFPEQSGDSYREALFEMGTVYLVLNRFEEALSMLQEAEKEILPGKTPPAECMRLYRRLALLLKRNGDMKEAGAYLDKAASVEAELPEDKRKMSLSFNTARQMRPALYVFTEECIRKQSTACLRPAAELSPEAWEKIRRTAGQDYSFSDVVAFTDESPLRDLSQFVLVLEQGIFFRTKKKDPEFYSWYDIESVSLGDMGGLGIHNRGTRKSAHDWYELRDRELIRDLISSAIDCGKRISIMRTPAGAAPEPEPGILDPEAVFARFHVQKEAEE